MQKPSETGILDIFFGEVLLAVLTGSTPVWITYAFGGVQGLERELCGLMNSQLVMYWTVIMSMFGYLLLILNKYKFKQSSLEETIWKKIMPISSEFSSSLAGMLRVIAGLLIGFILLWICVDYKSFNVRGNATFFIYATFTLFDSAGLTWLKQFIEKQV